MQSLENVVARNAYAAGREAAHADNDWNDKLASSIVAAELEANGGEMSEAFKLGYLHGKEDG